MLVVKTCKWSLSRYLFVWEINCECHQERYGCGQQVGVAVNVFMWPVLVTACSNNYPDGLLCCFLRLLSSFVCLLSSFPVIPLSPIFASLCLLSSRTSVFSPSPVLSSLCLLSSHLSLTPVFSDSSDLERPHGVSELDRPWDITAQAEGGGRGKGGREPEERAREIFQNCE